jgi:hypothetical protein
MGATLSFRFADEDLNLRLIAPFRKKEIRHFVDENEVIHYSREDEDSVENHLIRSIRNRVFSSWQVLSCPTEWTGRYKLYMSRHDIPFKEELIDGQAWFLLPRKYRSQRWKLEVEVPAPAK